MAPGRERAPQLSLMRRAQAQVRKRDRWQRVLRPLQLQLERRANLAGRLRMCLQMCLQAGWPLVQPAVRLESAPLASGFLVSFGMFRTEGKMHSYRKRLFRTVGKSWHSPSSFPRIFFLVASIPLIAATARKCATDTHAKMLAYTRKRVFIYGDLFPDFFIF